MSASVPGNMGGLLPSLEQIYKDLHIHPELSMQETRTAGVAAEKLRAAGVWHGTLMATFQPIPGLGKQRGRADQPGDVHVVAAGVHHAGRCARIGKAGGLGDRQRIHVGAQHHLGPSAVLEQPDHTRLPHT